MYLSIWFPYWSVGVARRRLSAAEKRLPLIIVGKNGAALEVRRACALCESQGVRVGHSLELARALMPDALVRQLESYLDLRMLHALALWATRFTPLVALDTELSLALRRRTLDFVDQESWGITLDLRGTERINAGLGRLVERIKKTMERRNIEARYALAPTLGAAWGLSRYGTQQISVTDSQQHSRYALGELMGDLPVQSLRLEPSVVVALQELGLSTVRTLRTITHREIVKRFGTGIIIRLDQAFGSVPEVMRCVHAPQEFCTQRVFDIPLLNHQGILAITVRMLENLIAKLQQQRISARRFQLVFYGRNTLGIVQRLVKEIALLAASHNSHHLISVITPVIEKLSFAGGIEAIGVRARSLQRDIYEQGHLSSSEYTPLKEERANLLNQLCVRLGRSSITVARFAQSYVPERSFSYQALELSQHPQKSCIPTQIFDLPTHLFSRPEMIGVLALLPDRPPTTLLWRNEKLVVAEAYGPERISDEWWHRPLKTGLNYRDYFKVQDQKGRWLWVFRHYPSMSWFIHGIWG